MLAALDNLDDLNRFTIENQDLIEANLQKTPQLLRELGTLFEQKFTEIEALVNSGATVVGILADRTDDLDLLLEALPKFNAGWIRNLDHVCRAPANRPARSREAIGSLVAAGGSTTSSPTRAALTRKTPPRTASRPTRMRAEETTINSRRAERREARRYPAAPLRADSPADTGSGEAMKSAGIKLTIFTIFTAIVTVALSTVIGNFSLIADTYQVNAEFDDATGVLNGDLVKIAGVDVGRVVGFEVDKGRATVTLQLNSDVQVPENAIVEIKYRNLLGQRVINIDEPEGVESNEMLADGDTIPASQTRPALDLDILFNNLRPLIQSTNPEDINVVARTVLKIFEGKEGELGEILGNLGDVTKEFAGGDGRLVRLVGNLRDLTDVLNNQSGNVRKGLENFVELMESLDEITPNIEQAVVQLDTLSRKFQGVLEDNRVVLRQDLDDLATLLTLVNQNLGPLDRATANLKEVLLATARSQSYGRWWNLYVVNLCPEAGFVDPALGGQCTPLVDEE